MQGIRIAGCLVAIAVLVGEMRAADWAQFRGPNRDDISSEKGLLKDWGPKGPTLLWKANGVGGGYSSLAVVGDRIYTLGNKGNRTFLHAVDNKKPKVIWSVDIGQAGGDLGCTPTVHGDRVYTISQEGDLACVGVKEKKVLWSKQFKKDFQGEAGGWRYCESPLVDGDKLVCTPGAKAAIMVAFDKKTGKVIWKAESPFKSHHAAGYSSIVIAEVKGVRMYVQLSAGGVFGVDASTGKVLWHYAKFAGNTANIPTPIVLGDHIFTGTGYGRGGSLLRLVPDGSGGISVEEVYHSRELTNKHGGLLVHDGHVYGDHDDSGRPFCAEVKTGKVMWRREGGGAGTGSGSASVTYADGHLYFLYQNSTMSLVKATPDEYKEVSRFKVPNLGGRAWAHPVISGGRLYLRGSDIILCYDVKAR